jgi:hypothetical protein
VRDLSTPSELSFSKLEHSDIDEIIYLINIDALFFHLVNSYNTYQEDCYLTKVADSRLEYRSEARLPHPIVIFEACQK